MAKEKLASRFGRSVYIWKDLNQYSWFNSLHDKDVYIYFFFNYTYFTFIHHYFPEAERSAHIYLKCIYKESYESWNVICSRHCEDVFSIETHFAFMFSWFFFRHMCGICCMYSYIYIYWSIFKKIYIQMYSTFIMLFSLVVPNLCGWPNTLDVYYIYIYMVFVIYTHSI